MNPTTLRLLEQLNSPSDRERHRAHREPREHRLPEPAGDRGNLIGKTVEGMATTTGWSNARGGSRGQRGHAPAGHRLGSPRRQRPGDRRSQHPPGLTPGTPRATPMRTDSSQLLRRLEPVRPTGIGGSERHRSRSRRRASTTCSPGPSGVSSRAAASSTTGYCERPSTHPRSMARIATPPKRPATPDPGDRRGSSDPARGRPATSGGAGRSPAPMPRRRPCDRSTPSGFVVGARRSTNHRRALGPHHAPRDRDAIRGGDIPPRSPGRSRRTTPATTRPDPHLVRFWKESEPWHRPPRSSPASPA